MTGLGGRRQRGVWLLVGAVAVAVAVVSAGYVVRQLSHGGLKASHETHQPRLPLASCRGEAGPGA